jgi:RNA polymerase sigma-70 factor (ECF subfamily)
VQAISNILADVVATPEVERDELDNLQPGDLARQCQAGSPEAFAALVTQFQERIYNFLLKMTGRSHDAEDLTQETFLKAWQGIGRFDPQHSFSSWLFTIAKRTALNHFRSRRPMAELEEAPEPADDSDPSVVLAQDEQNRELWSLARTLKPRQYQVLWLRYAEGFSVEETARIMGLLPIHTRVLLHRGRNQLAHLLQSKPGREGNSNHQPAKVL